MRLECAIWTCFGAFIGTMFLPIFCMEMGCDPLAKDWNPTLMTWGIVLAAAMGIGMPIERGSFPLPLAHILSRMTGTLIPFMLQAGLAAIS